MSNQLSNNNLPGEDHTTGTPSLEAMNQQLDLLDSINNTIALKLPGMRAEVQELKAWLEARAHQVHLDDQRAAGIVRSSCLVALC
jgi:hypothetical protein